MGLLKEIKKAYENRLNQAIRDIISSSVGWMVAFLEWKGLTKKGDYEQFLKAVTKQQEDLVWLKKKLEELRQ